jgi:hypothetical protein
MKCAVEMSSGAMTYIPSFIKIDSCIQKLMRVIHRMVISQVCFLSFQNKESRLKIEQVLGKTNCLLSFNRTR